MLSHRSSLRDGISYALPLGTSVEQAVAAPEAWDLEHPPGAYFRYSNLGFPVVATVMEQATGERFDRLMDRLVLKPLELDACFNWTTCSDVDPRPGGGALRARRQRCVRDDLKGAPPPCPVVPAADGGCDLSGYRLGSNGALFSPQGGLRISVRDLAKVGGLLLRKGRLSDGRRFLSEASLAEMERLHWRFDGGNGDTEGNFYCGYGLAVQILAQCAPKDDPFGDRQARLGHAGDAYGLRSGLWIDPATGRGIAYFATGLGRRPATRALRLSGDRGVAGGEEAIAKSSPGFPGEGTAPFDAACGVAQDKLRLRRSAVEGFFEAKEPLHQASHGPPPREIAGRIWGAIRSRAAAFAQQIALPEHQAGPEGVILIGLLGEAVAFVLGEEVPGGAAVAGARP